MSWRVLISSSADKQLRKIPQNYNSKIKKILEDFKVNPYVGDIIRLAGQKNIWRRRIGTYRIVYEINQKANLVFVFDITQRTSSIY